MTIEQARKDIQALRDEAQTQLESTKTEEQTRLETLIENFNEVLKELEESEPLSEGWTACTPKDIRQAEAQEPQTEMPSENKVNPNISYPTCPKCLSTRVLMQGGVRYCADCDTKHIWTAVEVPPGFLEAVGDAPGPCEGCKHDQSCSGTSCGPGRKKVKGVAKYLCYETDDSNPPAPEPTVPECIHRNPTTNMCADGLPCKVAFRSCGRYATLDEDDNLPTDDAALTAKGEALLCPSCRNSLSYPSVERDDEYWCESCDVYVSAHAAIVEPKGADTAPAPVPEILSTVMAYNSIPIPIRTEVCTALLDIIFSRDSVTKFKAKPLLYMVQKLYPKLKPRSCESVLSAYMAFLVRKGVVERIGVGPGTKYRRAAIYRAGVLDILRGA